MMSKHLRRVILLFFLMATIFSVSCDKNDDNGSGNGNNTEVPSSLVGTKWSGPLTYETYRGYTIINGLDYYFISSTSVNHYLWGTVDGEEISIENYDCTYVYHAPRGTIYENGEAVNFVIDGNVMILSYSNGNQYALERQR